MKTIEERLDQVEARLARIEQLLPAMTAVRGTVSDTPSQETASAVTELKRVNQPPVTVSPLTRKMTDPVYASASASSSMSVTQILGWTGATALVLAVAYLIRLAMDAGWLTPERQLGLAVLSGFALIGTGLKLRAADKQYASLLPAGGLVVLFLSIYGAHLYYHFIGVPMATGAVILTCLFALWLGRLFESEIYGLFAVTGSYSAPFLLHTLAGSVTDLVIYFSAWSVLFCLYSIWIGNRRPYLLAAYLALLGFHYLWRQMAPGEWEAAFAFQVIQFMIFIGGAVSLSIRHQRPLSREEAAVHLPLLLIFYALQYELLQRHLPALAPWIALGSAGVLLLGYAVAKRILERPLESGAVLVGAYASLALFHAGYMELLPDAFAPWVALLMLPALGLLFRTRGGVATVPWPVRVLIAIVFAINYQRVLVGANLDSVPAHQLLALLYAAELYVAYVLAQRMPALQSLATPALYVGHVALMSAAVQIFDGELAVSFAWGAIALACLALAFKYRDQALGKSSLLIFAASAAKVMLFDLSSATPLVRIGLLLVLGVTLYVGGWMYKKVDALDARQAAG
ncbi:MAG: DUF2339 domain-containing protein [Thiobacillus sp.]|nr:DUF2339 domain-containing protein [Thiobacillus sp.]